MMPWLTFNRLPPPLTTRLICLYSNSTGGIAGQIVEIEGLAANLWFVEIRGDAAGTESYTVRQHRCVIARFKVYLQRLLPKSSGSNLYVSTH